ncbi:dynamin-2-like [Aphidius gifuensis]|uniref:dynamin-2-like n=1 Tax=Aphidius gifuensis TaxID=684658 RepID=UPI001CDD6CD4|nr:dynamin-2-like [Aphidius gifuensis]
MPEVQEDEKFRFMINSYWKIVTKNINDIVPKVIMYFVIENIKKFIKHDLLVELLISNDKSSLMELSKHEKDKRDEFLRTREALEEALNEIDSFHEMSSFTSIE